MNKDHEALRLIRAADRLIRNGQQGKAGNMREARREAMQKLHHANRVLSEADDADLRENLRVVE